MKHHFNDDWKQWIKTNVDAGHNKDGIFKILLDEGYAMEAIIAEMKYKPQRPVEELVNPHKEQRERAVRDRNNYGASIDRASRFIPNSGRLDTDKVEFYLIPGFLNKPECERLVELIGSKLQPSVLSSFEADKTYRTSQTCYLENMDDPLVASVNQRISSMLGIDPSYSEAIQGQHYEIGQEFKPHTDFFEEHEMAEHGGVMGQRTYTCMIYLNDVEEGGETVFPELPATVKPKAGTAVIWNSLNPDGSTNYNSLHHAKSVVQGSKTVITKWFRSGSSKQPAPPMNCKTANEFVPNFTRDGVLKIRFPDDVYQEVKAFYDERRNSSRDEDVPGGFVYSERSGKRGSVMVDLSAELREKIHDTMKPLLEKWCGRELEPTYVYGIRVYGDGAVLTMHRDRLETHIISAIINVDQEVEEDWPLVIEDNYYRVHHVMLKPGEAVFYEGARLLHGRPIAFKGSSFANIFCHFKPVGYVPRKLA